MSTEKSSQFDGHTDADAFLDWRVKSELYPYFSLDFSGTEWMPQTHWLIRDKAGRKHCFFEDIWFMRIGFSTLQTLDSIFRGGTMHKYLRTT